MNRQQQKLKTRQSIIDAAFSLMEEQRSLSSISLREITRVAGIAPTSFYRHFSSVDELGLTLVDEVGLTLRQLMRKARSRMKSKQSVIQVSVDTFMEYIATQSTVFRLLLREQSGHSAAFRTAVAREITHFTQELTDFIVKDTKLSSDVAALQAEAMVKLVFSAGAEALELTAKQRDHLSQRVVTQLRFIATGALVYAQQIK